MKAVRKRTVVLSTNDKPLVIEACDDGLEVISAVGRILRPGIDVISAIEFDDKGDYLAIGDNGGRVVIFQKNNKTHMPWRRKQLEPMDYTSYVFSRPIYFYKTEFQSHEMEFDYLNSLEIGEKINKLRWCAAYNNDSIFILSTNDRTIKLWKVSESKGKKGREMEQIGNKVYSENELLAEMSFAMEQNEHSVLNGYQTEWINKRRRSSSSTCRENHTTMFSMGENFTAKCRRIYSQAHEYNINSISNNSDYATFISADDLRINLWNLEVSNQCFNIVDIKPLDMEDLVEVITSAEFHPHSCNLLAYCSSRGFIRLVDMRQSAICDQNARVFQDRDARGSRSFFNEIASSISDIKFTKDGRHVLTRDYMNLKLWDLKMERTPLCTYKIHEHLRPKLTELYNNDFIFDQFDCCLSADGSHFATGTYSNCFKIFSHDGGNVDGVTVEASRTPNRVSHYRACSKSTGLLTSFARGLNRRGHDNSNTAVISDIPCDFHSKLIHLASHPSANLITCASKGSLYLYYL